MLKLMYITNDPEIAKIAVDAGVDRIFIDMETLGKAERQKGHDTVRSHHTAGDIAKVHESIGNKAEILARVNPLNPKSEAEINSSIENGADIIMLPMWRTADDIKQFVGYVDKRVRVMPLLETAEAAENIDSIDFTVVNEIHIGLNDLHLSYQRKFMFELLADGTVDSLCSRLKKSGIRYGFGGIGRPGSGLLPAEYIIREHYRLGSQFAILSRCFCDVSKIADHDQIQKIFNDGIAEIRKIERECLNLSEKDFQDNHHFVVEKVAEIIKGM